MNCPKSLAMGTATASEDWGAHAPRVLFAAPRREERTANLGERDRLGRRAVRLAPPIPFSSAAENNS